MREGSALTPSPRTSGALTVAAGPAAVEYTAPRCSRKVLEARSASSGSSRKVPPGYFTKMPLEGAESVAALGFLIVVKRCGAWLSVCGAMPWDRRFLPLFPLNYVRLRPGVASGSALRDPLEGELHAAGGHAELGGDAACPGRAV
jgi:hypothetical protein